MKYSTLILLISSIAPTLHCGALSERSRISPRQAQSPYASLNDSDNPSCCTSIGIQQCLYKKGCTCEHPCAFFTATGCAGDATAVGVFSAAACGPLSMQQVGLPTLLCLGIPSSLLTGFAAYETYKRCKSNNTDQLDYITDTNNWPKESPESKYSAPDTYGYDSGYDS